jgi:hypothetical protein
MATFVFLSNLNTEKECIDRSLFGTNPGETHKHHYSKIEVGDRLFLYNYDTGRLSGPFAAVTRCMFNLEPDAWRKSKGAFPWQVRVDGEGRFSLPLTADEFRSFLPLSITRIGVIPPAELTDEQVAALMEAFKTKQR